MIWWLSAINCAHQDWTASLAKCKWSLIILMSSPGFDIALFVWQLFFPIEYFHSIRNLSLLLYASSQSDCFLLWIFSCFHSVLTRRYMQIQYLALSSCQAPAFSFLIQVNLDMTDHCTTDFCIWRTNFLGTIGSVISKFTCMWLTHQM